MIPSTVSQILILLVALVPGVVYRSIRVRATGRNASDASMSHRALRAFVASVVFVASYGLALGDDAADYVAVPTTLATSDLALAAIVGGVGIPAFVGLIVNAAAAVLSALRQRLMYEATFEPGSREERLLRTFAWIDQNVLGTVDELRPWDARVPGLAPCWVRIRKSDGVFIMGFLNSSAHVSTFPDPEALYVGVQADVDESGRFEGPTNGSKGFWYQVAPGDIVEFIGEVPITSNEPSTREQDD